MKPKDKFLASALKLFNENWFENTSTASICADAGYTSGAMFFHFKTKNDLLDNLYISIKKKSADYILKNMEDDFSIDNTVREVIKLWFNYYLNNYEEFVFMKAFTDSKHISRIAKDEIEGEKNMFFKILEGWKSNWLFIEEDTDLIFIWINAMIYYFTPYIKENQWNSLERSVNFIMKSILK